MGYLLIIFCVGIPLIKDGISVDKVCTFSTNFQRFICPSLPYQHRTIRCDGQSDFEQNSLTNVACCHDVPVRKLLSLLTRNGLQAKLDTMFQWLGLSPSKQKVGGSNPRRVTPHMRCVARQQMS